MGSYIINVHGTKSWNTWQLEVRDGNIAHQIRDALYSAMAPTRQLDEKKKDMTVSRISCQDQMSTATPGTATKGKGITGAGTNHMVVTHDRVLLNRHHGGLPCGGGVKNEWVSVFLKDIEGIEITKPAQWPTVSFCAWIFMNFDLNGALSIFMK